MRTLGLFVLSFGGLALAASPAFTAEPLDGARIYQEQCSRCHQPRTPADLSPSGWRAAAFHMRVKANLTRAELEALEAFLIPEPTPSGQTSPLMANPVYARECQRCHTAERVELAVASGRDAATWNATFTRMRAYGAQLTNDEASDLATWLAAQASTP